jgi:hypothetical protein
VIETVFLVCAFVMVMVWRSFLRGSWARNEVAAAHAFRRARRWLTLGYVLLGVNVVLIYLRNMA